jgi:hypothetical protein
MTTPNQTSPGLSVKPPRAPAKKAKAADNPIESIPTQAPHTQPAQVTSTKPKATHPPKATSAKASPPKGTPAKRESAKATPTKAEATKATPAQAEAAKTTPTKATPPKKASAAKATPADAAPAKKAPAAKAAPAAKKAPAAKAAPAKKAPAAKASAATQETTASKATPTAEATKRPLRKQASTHPKPTPAPQADAPTAPAAPLAPTKPPAKAKAKAQTKPAAPPSPLPTPASHAIAGFAPDTACCASLSAFLKTPRDPNTLAKVMAAATPQAGALLDITLSEPGVVIAEQLAAQLSPSALWPLLSITHPRTQDLVLDHWQSLIDAVPAGSSQHSAVHDVISCAYIAVQAQRAVKMLREDFLEPGDDPRSLGDLYIAASSRYFLNYSYLCSDLGMSRAEVVGILESMLRAMEPTPQQWAVVGGRPLVGGLIEQFEPLNEGCIVGLLTQLVGLVDVPFSEVPKHLPKELVSKLALVVVARRLGMVGSLEELVEVYELMGLRAASGGERALMWDVWENMCRFEPARDAQGVGPSQEWGTHWQGMRATYGDAVLGEVLERLILLYQGLGEMLGQQITARWVTAWQAISFERGVLAQWLVEQTTSHGGRSPLKVGGMLHPGASLGMVTELVGRWRQRVDAVPERSSWSREQSLWVLRHAVERQRRWLMEQLTDLYLRGGGYEAGESKELIEIVLERILDTMSLDRKEQQQLDGMGLQLELMAADGNVLTGERVDASRWASPTTAYKYVSALLTLEERPVGDLLGMVSERRLIALEKLLKQLDFHTSAQQVVAAVSALKGDVERGLRLWLHLRDSDGEVPSAAWMETVKALLSPLVVEEARDLLWELYRWDMEDDYSLNPGIFWALRLVSSPTCIARLARVATDVVRRKPSFAVAALDTLEAILSRSALSAILQMRRRIRNRKVLKKINALIDRIANADGMDRDVFLDYAVDTADLEANGCRCFDFGTHQVTLRLEVDGRISAHVLDGRGRQLRSFPKTARDANPELYKEFQSVKKVLVDTLAYQARRLEQAMVSQRVWIGQDFLDVFGQHPVMGSLAKRLLWGRLTVDADVKDSWVMTENGPVGVDGRPFPVGPEDRVVILHPVFCPERLRTRWKKQFESMGIIQPFSQLDRDIYKPLPSELTSDKAQRLIGVCVASQDLYRVVKERGWSTEGGGPWEVGQGTHSHRIYGLNRQRVHMRTSVLGYEDLLTILDIHFTPEEGKDPHPLQVVEPVVYSEAFRDLMHCVQSTDPSATTH